MGVEMEEDSPMHDDDNVRAGRCVACCRPVWPALTAERDDAPAAPPELCDYCRAASH
jgi:hypothetical protein